VAYLVVDQLRFARTEFVRSLDGVSEEDATRRFGAMNSISWIVGHLSDQEQRYWIWRRGEPLVVDGLNDLVGYGKPASTPPLAEMWRAWDAITSATEPYLESLTIADLQAFPLVNGAPHDESVGTMILRVTGHYWFHNGEAQAIRQVLGHTNLPEFVGDIGKKAPYRPDAIPASE
jgi:DinB superfamily